MARHTLSPKSAAWRPLLTRRAGGHSRQIWSVPATGASRLAPRSWEERPPVREPPRPGAAGRCLEILLCVLVAAPALCVAAPASAQQVSGSISVETDLRVRGYSLSAGRPVATARAGLDDASGFYADGSGTIVFSQDDGVRLLGLQADAGFAKRLGDLWTIDIGVAHNGFRAPYEGAFSHTYTEAYVGATRGRIAAYVFVSPGYYRKDVWTVYGQLEANLTPARDWRVTAHVGSLNYLYTPHIYTLNHKTYYDWRLGVARELGRLEVHAAVSGGGPGRQYYYGNFHSRTVLTAGASVGF